MPCLSTNEGVHGLPVVPHGALPGCIGGLFGGLSAPLGCLGGALEIPWRSLVAFGCLWEALRSQMCDFCVTVAYFKGLQGGPMDLDRRQKLALGVSLGVFRFLWDASGVPWRSFGAFWLLSGVFGKP